MKKALLAALVVAFVVGTATVALAATPPTVIGADGSSVWTYRDLQDTAAKSEGGYNAFQGDVTVNQATDDGAYGVTTSTATNQGYTSSPHGGYDTTTNKCKVCHAVHRAEGAYFLLRADSQDDACSYCHIGGSAHSGKVVYDLNPDGIYTQNGHTIGAQKDIPDSTVRQYASPVELSTTDSNGVTKTIEIEVRAYDAAKNQMYRFGRHHGQSDEGTGRNGYAKIGPLSLRCMNCHQTHGAVDEVWRPLAWVGTSWGANHELVQDTSTFEANGYKLLKRYPSASTTGAINSNGYYNVGQNVKAIEGNAVKDGHTGPWGTEAANFSGMASSDATYSQNGEVAARPVWIAQDIHEPSPSDYSTPGTGYYRYPYFNSKYALSWWCADCHNLNVGGWEPLADASGTAVPELGFKAHTERTHPAPYYGAYTGPGQCYSCHRNDLSPKMNSAAAGGSGRPTVAGRDSCTQCHYGTKDYAIEMGNEDAAGTQGAYADLGLDFPHSGRATDIKLLGSYTTSLPAGGGTVTGATTMKNATITEGNIDAVCIRCHPGVGVHQ